MHSLNGMKKGEEILITSRLQYPKHQCCEALNFSKDFFLYSFASDQSLAAVLTQKDDENNEALVSFMSTKPSRR
jgi:hypothetical protein